VFDLLRKNIEQKVKISDTDFDRVISFVSPVSIKRKQIILQAGEICRHSIFISKGCLRSYSLDEKGIEHVTQIQMEDHWIADLYSLITRKPTDLYIEALEDCDLILLPGNVMESMYMEVPSMERFFRLMMQNAYVATQRRLNAALSISAEERYVDLLKTYPNLFLRVPLVHIASYLGITPESLSRIRKQVSKKSVD
jgi:CRP-like cAMP-binding protein